MVQILIVFLYKNRLCSSFTKDQNLNLQIEALENAGCEKISGATKNIKIIYLR